MPTSTRTCTVAAAVATAVATAAAAAAAAATSSPARLQPVGTEDHPLGSSPAFPKVDEY
jgi:Spy/CpxP family protein refolding chaperone